MDKVKVYGHAACPGVPPLRGLLNRSKVAYDYVDIHTDRAAASLVRSLNNGNESVPTLVFPDGSVLTEPAFKELKAKLETLGYRVGPVAWLVGNIWVVIVAVGLLIAVLRSLGVF